MTTEEYKAWRSAVNVKRFSYTVSRWRNGNAPIDKKKYMKSNNTTVPEIKAKANSSPAPKKFCRTPA